MNKQYLIDSLEKTYRGETKLPPEVFNLPGMSGRLNRIFLNNLCNFNGCNYLEIGTWQGSTLVSAAYGNTGKFTGIDNFSQFSGNIDILNNHLNLVKPQGNVTFFESDCWICNNTPSEVNVYFFDGAHDYDSQYRAIRHFINNMSSTFLLIVDDWNDASNEVQNGTRNAIKDEKLSVEYAIEVGKDRESDSYGWWNGLGIFLLNKQ